MMMLTTQLADHEEAGEPYVILEDGVWDLWTEFDGGEVWWRNRDTGDAYEVTLLNLYGRTYDTSDLPDTTSKLLHLCCVAAHYDFADHPHSVNLDDIHAAFASGRIGREPEEPEMIQIYCYAKPGLIDGTWLGVASDVDGNVILEHPSTDKDSVRPAMGFDGMQYCHKDYDAKYGRGMWKLVWLSNESQHPARGRQTPFAGNPPVTRHTQLQNPTPVQGASAEITGASRISKESLAAAGIDGYTPPELVKPLLDAAGIADVDT